MTLTGTIRAGWRGGYRLFVIMDNLFANKTPAIRRQRQLTWLAWRTGSSGPAARASFRSRRTRQLWGAATNTMGAMHGRGSFHLGLDGGVPRHTGRELAGA